MGLSSKPTSSKPFRSFTLPCRSHPRTYKIDKVLNKVKTWESSSSSNPSGEIICSGLSQLIELYECFDNLVKTSLSQSLAISTNQNMKWTDELLNESVKFLDICSNTTDVISQTKHHLRDLACELRRKGGSSVESIVSKFMVFRNKLKKDVKRSIASLKRMDNMMICDSPIIADSGDHHLASVIRVFREVTESSNVIFGLLLMFLAGPILKTKRPRWTAISRLLSNGKVAPEEKSDTNVNEFQSLDAALLRYGESDKQEFIEVVQKNLVALEATLGDFDSHLDLLSRRLIATRASLLNMISFY